MARGRENKPREVFLHASSLVGRNLFPAIIAPAFPVVDKDLLNPVTTELCRRSDRLNFVSGERMDGPHSVEPIPPPRRLIGHNTSLSVRPCPVRACFREESIISHGRYFSESRM